MQNPTQKLLYFKTIINLEGIDTVHISYIHITANINLRISVERQIIFKIILF